MNILQDYTLMIFFSVDQVLIITTETTQYCWRHGQLEGTERKLGLQKVANQSGNRPTGTLDSARERRFRQRYELSYIQVFDAYCNTQKWVSV